MEAQTRVPKTKVADRLGAIPGLTFGDCVKFFAAQQSPGDKQYVAAAKCRFHRDGEIEVDDCTIVCVSDEMSHNGAFVMGWFWVDADHAADHEVHPV